MGAQEFTQIGYGETPAKAFADAFNKACYDYGHRGYTESMAEKGSYVEIPLSEGRDPIEFADELIRNSDERIDDKWGPAGCIKMAPDKYLISGWASS